MAPNQTQLLVAAGLATVVTVGLLLMYTKKPSSGNDASDSSTSRSLDMTPPRSASDKQSSTTADSKTPLVKNTSKSVDDKEIHAKIEELDKKGKALFKNKQFMEAAQSFTEALDFIEKHDTTKGETQASLLRQKITLLNNRSAMYEKASVPELALEDCTSILELEMNHTKARTRKLRILESLDRYHEALVEACAVQLLFMQANRTSLRMGLPVPPPPVPQSKLEDILSYVLGGEMEPHLEKLAGLTTRPIPSSYTILQLLKSFSGYNAWMAKAATDGSVEKISAGLVPASDVASTAARATGLLKRGRRKVYDRQYEAASLDFEEAFSLVDSRTDVQAAMEGDSLARLYEWTAMVRHWHYNLDSSFECYQKCADLEPLNALVLVKQAGTLMDSGKHEEAVKLFDTALGIDSNSVDALFHRSNLRMLQGNPEAGKKDLEKVLSLHPKHVMARLRLASLLAAASDNAGAKKQLDAAQREEPNSSEVHSYRGELFFTQGQMVEAREEFEKAMKLEPQNPTPYVNAAMALLNTPPEPGQKPDAQGVINLLEQAIEVDPHFTAAYIQLGQLKLGTAVELTSAREVITLYDQGLENCRSPEEIKELCSMRALAVAQVDAASLLKMETFNMS